MGKSPARHAGQQPCINETRTRVISAKIVSCTGLYRE